MTDKTSVETITHAGRRANIPSAELESVLPRADREPIRTAWERRDPDLDPQLVWRGKDLADWSDLIVQAPPVYLQEQIHPKALIENLRASLRGGRRGEAGGGPDLFDHFGLTEEDREAEVEFYRHSRKWSNRMILGDSLAVMASLAQREGLRGSVQAIYIDPPYGIRFNSNFQWSTTSRDVKDGNLGHLTREPEQVKAFRDTWRDGIHSYLTYLRDRLTVARELLTESGSCFVQIGDENVHRVRALMGEVFGEENFVAQISVKKTSGATSDYMPGTVDYVLFFAKKKPNLKYRQAYIERALGDDGDQTYRFLDDLERGRRSLNSAELNSIKGTAQSLRIYRQQTMTSQSLGRSKGEGAASWFPVLARGNSIKPPLSARWKTNESGMDRLLQAGRIEPSGRLISYLRYHGDFPVFPITDLWTDTQSGSAMDKLYVVQTSQKIIQRCLLMTTDPGDLVLDPTCGSGTTAFVAEQWGRRWITIDTSRVALALARARIMGAKFPYYLLADSTEGRRKEAEITRQPPPDTPTRDDIRQGFVYERVPHITLKSIANNAEIDVIWEARQPAVEAAREALNAALAGQTDRFEVTTGGRAGQTIDFTATGETPLPSGEPAPRGGFMEWEIPREPGTPWPRAERDQHAEARLWSADAAPATRQKAERALAALNTARKAGWTFETLPERPVTPWPEAADAAHARFWEARIARQKEIDASIAARAEFEYLYDKPYEDRKRIRVAGPFTVESLSPHRAATVGADGELIDELNAARGAHARETEAESYVEAILENLRRAGVHQKDKGDRIAFTSLKPWPGEMICAEGRYPEGDPEAPVERRAGIFIGPEYGTVQRADLVAAAREAAEAGLDVVIACAFNFDAHASEFHRLGAIPVLQARMNPDLHMAGELKAGGGNLFTIFGEPDIEILEEGGTLRVALKGVDIFKPALGRVDSSDADEIACWFIDTDYNEESFFVRHAYFPAADIPYKAIRTTLKAEIDEDAWESLKATVSRPFPRPRSGRIAVKVINHLGDEVMKVFGV